MSPESSPVQDSQREIGPSPRHQPHTSTLVPFLSHMFPFAGSACHHTQPGVPERQLQEAPGLNVCSQNPKNSWERCSVKPGEN